MTVFVVGVLLGLAFVVSVIVGAMVVEVFFRNRP